MHDLDRAMFETGEIGQETEQPEHREQQEFLEVLGGLMQGSSGQGETYESYEMPDGRELTGSTQEIALANELLEAYEMGEMDRFIGNLLSRIGGAARNFARSDTGQALGGILKKAAGQALPVIGRGLGRAVGPQYAGLGERIGKGVGAAFGLELEGLSAEDREFEMAKAFVRFANAAANRAARAPAGGSPQAVARAAAIAAAQRFAPGLVATLNQGGAAGRPRGQWVRRGDQIVIFGV
jgi:hypothetical protein